MKHITSTIARLYPFDLPVLCNGERFERKHLEQLTQTPLVESMFVFIANARNLLMFNAPLFDAEIIGGDKPEINWLNERAVPAPSDYAPVLLDVWEFDIGNAALKTNELIDISGAVNEWKQLAESQPQLIDPIYMLDALHDIELENSELRKLSSSEGQLAAAVVSLLDVRRSIETTSQAITSPELSHRLGG